MSLDVDTQMLNDYGKTIYGYGEDYLSEVASLYRTVENLNASWSGTDSSSYVNKVNSYKKDIENLGNAIKDYGTFLQSSADTISQLRSEIQKQSSNL